MFGAIGVIAGLGLAYAFLLSRIDPLMVFLWISTAVFAVAATVVYAWLM
jgi:hypothetical protein